MEKFADVAVSLPIDNVFTYEVPDCLKEDCAVGKRVLVPFKKHSVTGYVVALKKDSAVKGIRPILDVLDESPLFDEKRLKFYRWMASYYISTPGEVLSLIHPSAADVKSFSYLSLTEKGRNLLDNPPIDNKGNYSLKGMEVLKAAKNGITQSSLIKKVKKTAVYSIISRLKKDSLIKEELRLKGGGGKRTERFAGITPGINHHRVFEEIKKFPLQKKLFEYLKGKEATPVSVIRKDVGAVGGALKKMGEKGIISWSEVEITPGPVGDPLDDASLKSLDLEPNKEQKEALDTIFSALGKGFSPYLLHGITGSGKTLVYMKAIEKVVESGKTAMYLLPEIALTHGVYSYLAGKFPGRVALVHSALSEGERYDQWQRIKNGEASVVIGARSALFSPLKNLGLIIVDEEHDPSYKEEKGVRYNARDASLMLGKILGITVILGSATPSLETFYNVKKGKITALYLRKRVEGAILPEVELLDMKKSRGVSFMSERLISRMEETLGRGSQVLLFLNRRGFSNFLICKDCGHLVRCLNCSVALTIHKRAGLLKCHYCDFSIPIPKTCPSCASYNLKDPGVGTEKVEEEVRRLFPKARVARLDRDTAKKKGSTRKIIDAVEGKRVDVLIGTQMVSKGHHFPGITLVGIISADTSLNIPDFRGAERTFQLISQASGRAGRGGAQSEVIVQTLNPGHFSFESAARSDYEDFFEKELGFREEAGFPPVLRLALLRVEGVKEDYAVKAAKALKGISDRIAGNFREVTFLGPAPCFMARLKGRWRFQMLLKSKSPSRLNESIVCLKKGFEKAKSGAVNLVIDVDPVNMS